MIQEPKRNLVHCYNEMVKAEKLLDEIGRLKGLFEELEGKNLKMIREFLDQ